MRWKLSTFLIVVPLLAILLAFVIQQFQKPPHDGVTQVIGRITSGDNPDLSGPTNDEVARAIERMYGSKGGRFANMRIAKSVPIEIQEVSSELEPARDYPLIGTARLHHQWWRCEFGVELPDGTIENRSITIDHNHFHFDDEASM